MSPSSLMFNFSFSYIIPSFFMPTYSKHPQSTDNSINVVSNVPKPGLKTLVYFQILRRDT